MRLAEWRIEKGLKQQELADSLGCTQPYISYVERTVRANMPSTEFMERVYRLTRGAVAPNDFVFPNGLPDLSTELPLGLDPVPAPLLDMADANEGEGLADRQLQDIAA